MDDATIREKLVKCFAAVFPELDPTEIESASAENTSGWDSIAQVTLLTLVGEEFGIDVDFDQFGSALSFSDFASLIQEITSHA